MRWPSMRRWFKRTFGFVMLGALAAIAFGSLSQTQAYRSEGDSAEAHRYSPADLIATSGATSRTDALDVYDRGTHLSGGRLRASGRPCATRGVVETSLGLARQGTSAAAMAARNEVEDGAVLWRIGTTGKSNAAEGEFWSLEHPPLSPGLPSATAFPKRTCGRPTSSSPRWCLAEPRSSRVRLREWDPTRAAESRSWCEAAASGCARSRIGGRADGYFA